MRWLGIRTALCPPGPVRPWSQNLFMRSKIISAVKAFRWQQWLVLAVFPLMCPAACLYPALAFSQLKLWQVIIVAAAAVLGDQIGYGVARWGGRRLVARISRRIGGEAKIRRAEALAKRCRTDHPGAKNSQPNPGDLSFPNCPILDSNLSRTGRSSGSSINTQTDPSARMRSHIGRCSELIDEHKKAARNGKMTI